MACKSANNSHWPIEIMLANVERPNIIFQVFETFPIILEQNFERQSKFVWIYNVMTYLSTELVGVSLDHDFEKLLNLLFFSILDRGIGIFECAENCVFYFLSNEVLRKTTNVIIVRTI